MNQVQQNTDQEDGAPEEEGAAAANRVTMEMVRALVGDENPYTQWGSQRLLDTIGFGSKRTHQKYLEVLRAEYAKAAMPVIGDSEVVPPMPKDLGDAFWRQAWTMAVSKSATYMTQLTVQRDALKVQLGAAQADIESHLNSSESAEELLKKAVFDAGASAEIAAAEKTRADAAATALDELKVLAAKNLADQMKISEDVCNALTVELGHVKQHSKEQLELAEKNAQLMLKGLQEVNSQQAQREVDLRNQIADANRRAADSTRRADMLAERLAGLSQPGKVQVHAVVQDRLEDPLGPASANTAE